MAADAQPQRKVAYRILGPVEVRVDGSLVPLGGARAQKALGVMLAEAGHVVPLDRLVATLWHDDPPATAKQQIHNVITGLRRLLEGVDAAATLTTHGSGYALELGAEDALDVSEFGRLVDTARQIVADRPLDAVFALRAALGLWRGDALAGHSGIVIEAVSAGLNERRLAAMEWLARLCIEHGRSAEISADLRRWVADHPHRERLHALLMLALYSDGNKGEALEAFRRVRRVLADDLGLDAGPELAELHLKILRDDPSLPCAVPPGAGDQARQQPTMAADFMPISSPDFVGREEEIATLTAAATAGLGSAVAIAIDGMAGIGKTMLAVRAAEELSSHFPDARLFVDFHGYTPSHQPLAPEHALDALLRQLGVPPERMPARLDDMAALWRQTLADRRVLVVMDNVEDSAQVRPLLVNQAGCLALITSRRRLSGLDAISALTLDVMDSGDAMELFISVVGARATKDAELSELVELCGRLPLAVRLAAAKLRHRPRWAIRDLTERLRDERRRLDELAGDDRSVRAAFAVSYQSLSDDQQQMFRLLGTAPGDDFDAYAAAALASVPVDRAERVLEDLLDHHLLVQHRPNRYTFHDLIRSHARDLAVGAETDTVLGAARHRVLDYYLASAHRSAEIVLPRAEEPLDCAVDNRLELPPMADRESAAAWLEAEDANLASATAFAAEYGFLRHSVMFPRLLHGYFLDWCRHAVWERLTKIAVESARRLGDQIGMVRNLQILGTITEALGDVDAALELYQASLDAATVIDDELGRAIATGSIGTALSILGRYDEGTAHLRQAIEINHANGHRYSEAANLINLGFMLGAVGATNEQLAALERARLLADELNHPATSLGVLVNMGSCLSRLQRFDEAEAELRKALAMAEETGNRRALPAVLSNLGRLCQRAGRPAEAVNYLNGALDAVRDSASPEAQARVLSRLADAEHHAGHSDKAFHHATKCLRLSSDQGFPVEAARSHALIATIHHERGEAPEAYQHWRRALTMYEDIGSPEAENVRARLAELRN